MEKLTISMTIFNSYVTLPGYHPIHIPWNHYKIPLNHYKVPLENRKKSGWTPPFSQPAHRGSTQRWRPRWSSSIRSGSGYALRAGHAPDLPRAGVLEHTAGRGNLGKSINDRLKNPQNLGELIIYRWTLQKFGKSVMIIIKNPWTCRKMDSLVDNKNVKKELIRIHKGCC